MHTNTKIYYNSIAILCYLCVIYKIAFFSKSSDPSESCFTDRSLEPTVTKSFLKQYSQRKFEIFGDPKYFWFWSYPCEFKSMCERKSRYFLKIFAQIFLFFFFSLRQHIFELMELLHSKHAENVRFESISPWFFYFIQLVECLHLIRSESTWTNRFSTAA